MGALLLGLCVVIIGIPYAASQALVRSLARSTACVDSSRSRPEHTPCGEREIERGREGGES